MHYSIDRTVHTTAFDKPVVDHWLERKIKCYQMLKCILSQSTDPLTKIYFKIYTFDLSYITIYTTMIIHFINDIFV